MREPTKHVVMFSGGVGSFETAWRIVQRHGRSAVTLLFTDTLHEDADLYRFLVESAAFITGKAGVGEVSGLSALAANTPPVWERDARKAHIANVRGLAATVLPQLVWLVDGRDIWEVFASERYLGNSQVGICTDRLKQTMRDGWMAAHCDPSNTACYVGIDWTEIHRFEGESEPDVEDAGQLDVFGVVPAVAVAPERKRRPGLRKKMAERGWCYEAPLCESPYIAKYEVFEHLRAVGIQAPRLYGYGFAHNNCGGGCVKAGIGHFAHLHRALPDVFAHWEREETKLRGVLGDVSILGDRRGGDGKKPLPLASLRARIEAGETIDMDEVGGCGCFIDTEGAA